MSTYVQRVRQTSDPSGHDVQRTTEVRDSRAAAVHSQNVAENIVWYLDGILMVLLGFRFILSLLGANTTNAFANFIYNVSHPFVAPFFSLFRYNNVNYGASRFEIYTLVAMLFYSVVAWGIARLITIDRD